LFTEIAFHWFI